jgi:outer membrane protein assembly factor BamB
MTRLRSFTALGLTTAAGAWLLAAAPTAEQGPAATAERYWGQWRGPEGTGVSRTARPPLEWSETRNVRWKKEIPGRGSGSPIVWGDRVFVLTAVPIGVPPEQAHEPHGARPVPHRYVVMALSRQTGDVIWERTAREEAPHESSHPDNGTWASPSAITDGEHVIAHFESRGLYAYDMDGALVWEKDFGDKIMRQQFGEGSTPALHGDRLVLVWDHQGQSFIAALDKRTGEEIWRVERDEIDTWSTPLIVPHEGRVQVITNAMNRVRAYDLATGEVVWHAPGTTMNAIPSPVFSDGIVYLAAGFRGNNLKAIRLAGANGDLTGTESIVWSVDRDTPYVPSPLLYEDNLYILKTNSGILTVYDAKSGKPHYALQRVPEVPNVFSSPVGADGRVYIPGREGTTAVLRNGATYELLAANELDDGFDASPALVDNELYLRGQRYLYCIAEE